MPHQRLATRPVDSTRFGEFGATFVLNHHAYQSLAMDDHDAAITLFSAFVGAKISTLTGIAIAQHQAAMAVALLKGHSCKHQQSRVTKVLEVIVTTVRPFSIVRVDGIGYFPGHCIAPLASDRNVVRALARPSKEPAD